MDRHEHYRKVEETIAKFKNGEERYRNSATFNRVVQMLVRGAEPLEVIDQLITITDDTQKAFEHYMIKAPMPPSMMSEEGKKHYR